MYSSKVAIIVLGMHRSGTSALTRLISLLGAGLPKKVMGANPSNERGHWEPDCIVHINDMMLAEADSRWDDWRSFDLSNMDDDRLRYYRASIRNLIAEEYDGAELIVMKDPRICRFATFYAGIFKELGYLPRFVIPFRNPMAVASSLSKRDEMSLPFAKMLWLRHNLDAEFATRGYLRCFLSYEELMADWRTAVRKLADRLELSWPRHPDDASAEASAFLSADLTHHRYRAADLEGNGPFDAWLRQAYSCLRGLEQDPLDAESLGGLDPLMTEINEFTSRAGELTFPELRRREVAFRSVMESHERQKRDIAELTAAFEAERSHKSQLEDHATSLSRSLEASWSEKASMEIALQGARHQIEAMENSTSWRITAPIRTLKSALS